MSEIINGIDVSGCELYDGTYKLNCDYQYRCENRPACYYKQLQRLSAEHERLIEQNKSLQAELREVKNGNTN